MDNWGFGGLPVAEFAVCGARKPTDTHHLGEPRSCGRRLRSRLLRESRYAIPCFTTDTRLHCSISNRQSYRRQWCCQYAAELVLRRILLQLETLATVGGRSILFISRSNRLQFLPPVAVGMWSWRSGSSNSSAPISSLAALIELNSALFICQPCGLKSSRNSPHPTT